MIRILDEQTANGIAAGEVVERPASVVKELIENALDAGANRISVEIEQGGISFIRVSDNGSGMSPSDARMAFERHATSKIRVLDDLVAIESMGFRGEALASIAAVANVRLTTRQKVSDSAYQIHLEAGKVLYEGVGAGSEGSIFEVRKLFFNTPARYKFLKRDHTEAAYVQDLIERHSFSRPDVSFSYKKDGKSMILTPGDHQLLSVLYTLWGKDSAEAAIPIDETYDNITIRGYVSKSSHFRKNRSRQIFILNQRVIQSTILRTAIDRAIAGHFVKGQFPELILNLEISPMDIDVNVHPQKTEVRFSDEQTIFRAVYHAISRTLEGSSSIKDLSISEAQPSQVSDNALQSSSENRQIAIPHPREITNLFKQESIGPFFSIENITQSTQPLNPDSLHQRLKPKEQALAFSEATKDRFVLKSIGDDSKSSTIGQGDGPSERIVNIRTLQEARIIGQVFNTYLLLEHNDCLLLVDQHAAHERILYEQLLNTHRASPQDVPKQMLLSPLLVSFSPLEIEKALEQKEAIESMGFEFEQFSDSSLVLRAVPANGNNQNYHPESAFRSIIEMSGEHQIDPERQTEEIYHTIACKAAVKGHDILSYTEMESLLDQLILLEDPFHCPHGRPVIVRISRNDMEKFFSRIV